MCKVYWCQLKLSPHQVPFITKCNTLPPEARDAAIYVRWVARHQASLLPSAHLISTPAQVGESGQAADPHLGNTQNKALTEEHDL